MKKLFVLIVMCFIMTQTSSAQILRNYHSVHFKTWEITKVVINSIVIGPSVYPVNIIVLDKAGNAVSDYNVVTEAVQQTTLKAGYDCEDVNYDIFIESEIRDGRAVMTRIWSYICVVTDTATISEIRYTITSDFGTGAQSRDHNYPTVTSTSACAAWKHPDEAIGVWESQDSICFTVVGDMPIEN